MSIREDFVNQLAINIKGRRDFTLYGTMPGKHRVPEELSIEESYRESMYMLGAREAIGQLIAMADDRELNEAEWRITTKAGEVVSFCNPDDKGYLDTPGLIAMFEDEINS